MVGAHSYVTHAHTHTHILSHGFSWAMFRIGEHRGRGTELCHTHTHTYCLMALVGQCSG